MNLVPRPDIPSGELKFLASLAGIFSVACLVMAVKYQVIPVSRDETPLALGTGALMYGPPLAVLGLFALRKYVLFWRVALVLPLLLFLIALGVSLV